MRIVVDPRQRIAEYGESFLERHAVLPKVRGGLLWVPRKSRRHHTKAYHPTIRGRLPGGLTLRLSCGARASPCIRRRPPARRQLQPVVRRNHHTTTMPGSLYIGPHPPTTTTSPRSAALNAASVRRPETAGTTCGPPGTFCRLTSYGEAEVTISTTTAPVIGRSEPRPRA